VTVHCFLHWSHSSSTNFDIESLSDRLYGVLEILLVVALLNECQEDIVLRNIRKTAIGFGASLQIGSKRQDKND
jgi:hypothetical protein